MLNYKVLASTGDTFINVPLSMDNNPKNHDEIEVLADATAQASVNLIVDKEKEGYEPKSSYKLQFNFWNGSGYSTSWNAAGFSMPTDIEKNVFKKSEFLIEFYDSLLTTNNLLFNTTLSVYPNQTNGKGCDSVGTGSAATLYSTFTITKVINELYLLFFNRDFNSLSNIKTDENGNKYVSLYMKAMFLNAKTGLVQYFYNGLNTSLLNNTSFTPSISYYEVRFYQDLTYSFYRNNAPSSVVNLNEIVINSA